MMRIGHGYDAHRLVIGRKMILCGAEIPSDFGPDGYSDADVPIHALCDAILGALSLGDIGKLFPPGDPQFAGISSIELLKRVSSLMHECGYALVNADITIILQSPKLAAYIPEMRSITAKALGVGADRISVKATTEEQMGFTGTGAGIASHAVVLLENQLGHSNNPTR